MSSQWIALDAYFFAKPFPLRLRERFGTTGQVVFIALVCAAKQANPQGEVVYAGEAHGLNVLRLDGLKLVNDLGVAWTLEDLWKFTGEQKQTRIKRHGRQIKVHLSHWERWQQTIGRDRAAERQRRWRGKNGRDGQRDGQRDTSVTTTVTDIDIDNDIPPTPVRRFALNGQKQPPDPPRRPIPDWQPDPDPDEPTIDQAAIKALRNRTQP